MRRNVKDKRFKGIANSLWVIVAGKASLTPARAIVNNQSLDLVLFTHLVREGPLILDDGEDTDWDSEERNF